MLELLFDSVVDIHLNDVNTFVAHAMRFTYCCFTSVLS